MRATILLAAVLAACAPRPPAYVPAEKIDMPPRHAAPAAPRPNDAAETTEERDYLADIWLATASRRCGLADEAEQHRLMRAVITGPTYRGLPAERVRQLNRAALELLRREGTSQCDNVAAGLPDLRARMRAATAPRPAPRRPEPPDTGWQPSAPAAAPSPTPKPETLDL